MSEGAKGRARASLLIISTICVAIDCRSGSAQSETQNQPLTQPGLTRPAWGARRLPQNGAGMQIKRAVPGQQFGSGLSGGGSPQAAQPARDNPPPIYKGPAGEALDRVLKGKLDDAKEILIRAYNQGKKEKSLDAEIPYFLAALEEHSEDFAQAIKYLEEAQSLLEKSGKYDTRSQFLMTKRLAHSYYCNHDFKSALELYRKALELSQKGEAPPSLVSELYEAIVGCEVHLKQYEAAERDARTHVQVAQAAVKKNGAIGLLSYSWALTQLSDVLEKGGKEEASEKEAVFKEWRDLNAQLVKARMRAEAEAGLPAYEQLVNLLRQTYISELAPASPAEIAWAAIDFRIKSLPLIVWRPAQLRPYATIICIHGLGLENRFFTRTAQQLTGCGYMVAALDVRGFGSWIQTQGEEDIDYSRCIEDIGTLARVLKERNPRIPVYVLGESMGGAIALRAAAKLGKQIDGVISSVPSAERFQPKRITFETALHLISEPHKEMDVGDFVAERATSQESLQKRWEKDPKARLSLSALELVKFNSFMKETKKYAGDIDAMPVLMLQGLKDRLVKPEGTYELFDAVASEDKSIIMLGPSEHLMFENPNPDPLVIEVVDAWLRSHLKLPANVVRQNLPQASMPGSQALPPSAVTGGQGQSLPIRALPAFNQSQSSGFGGSGRGGAAFGRVPSSTVVPLLRTSPADSQTQSQQ